ncbi:sulfite exporter TauE/SafE family protein [Glutamicibacter endophyticus]|uniref:sulfite exporter TauE/SafE family protein n=1 Tax=Glutamicibacter sp. PS TaxID=3075634 RepID=UPI0028420F7A|nr:sulfite exporter TauE/SafE family protein [Glutamicibacter sp. PS]MDR4532854.1 sulfite exporter TauE/SafE family protein [Glutamicibacter sp. PS]
MALDFWREALVFLGGLWAGTINTVVGSGTLVTFPILVALGIAPVNAVVSNAMGLVAGGFSGAWGYRREAASVRGTLLKLVPVSLIGGLIGSLLLLNLPESVFGVVAPILLVLALVLVIFQPRLAAWAKTRQAANSPDPDAADQAPIPPILYVLVFLIGIYGGYFTAAQGVLLMAVFGVFLQASLQQSNAIKVILSLIVNLVAAVIYLVVAPERIHWVIVLLIAVGSLIGGLVGAKIGRKLSPGWLRAVIVLLGLIALTNMVYKLVAGG